MELGVTTGAVWCAKLQLNHHHQQTKIQLFTGQMPFLLPNQQCQSTQGEKKNSIVLITVQEKEQNIFPTYLFELFCSVINNF